MSMSTGYIRTHIYIEDMRTKKALSIYVDSVGIRILYIAQERLVAFGASK